MSMTRKPDLGVMLGAAGGVLALGAIIAGFLIVGGPGDARARRLDDMVAQEMQQTAYAAQCAYWLTGRAQGSMATVESVIQDKRSEAEALNCTASAQPDKPRVTYAATDTAHIRLCGDFRHPSHDAEDPSASWRTDEFPELRQPRQGIGPHCYDVELRSPPSG
jgi:hypothetical protein